MPEFDEDTGRLRQEIAELKHTRNAVVLAHYYQRASVQDLADHLGDSLALARRATEVDQEVIVFCGVRFMAETAAILNPGKTVLLPEPFAGCDMAGMADPQSVEQRREELPEDTAVVSYVNSTTEVKAISDICCTSSNAVQVVESLPQQHVLFVPDRNLGSWVAEQTAKALHTWDGHCYVHDPGIRPESIRDLKQLHPEAAVLVHPECAPPVRNLAGFVGSTGAMLEHVAGSDRDSFIIGTEGGILTPLRERNPRKRFYATGSTCASMRLITMHSLRGALDRMETRIEVDPDLASRARGALERMVAI